MAILQIPITKAGNKPIPVETDTLGDAMVELIYREGLKVLLNAKMSKVSVAKLVGKDLEDAQAAAYEIGMKNFAALEAGTIVKGRTAAAKSGVPAEVRTEAMRLARAIVKDEARNAGLRPSLIPASEITAAAKQVLEDNPDLFAKAQENIDNRKSVTPKISLGGLKEDAKLVKAADEKKAAAAAARKSTLSAKQAGKVAPRKRSEAPHASH